MKNNLMDKNRRFLTTVPSITWWVADRMELHRTKKQASSDAEAIANIERLYRLWECGVLTEEEFAEMKTRLKQQLGGL